MKKKLLTMFLAGCMVLSVAACGKDTQGDTTQNNAGQTENVLGSSSLVKLGEYKGLTYVPMEVTVNDEEIEGEIRYRLAMTTKRVDQETVTEDSTVKIDYVGTKDGVAFEGGTAEDQRLDIANSNYIAGFAESIVGMKVGETKDCPMTFPADYHAAELAGAEVVFTITVNECWIDKASELNDDFAKEQGYDSVDAMYAGVREEYVNYKKKQAESDQATQLLEKLIADSTFYVNEEEVEMYVDRTLAEQEQYAETYGLDMENYVAMYGMTMDEFVESCRENALYQIQAPLVQFAVAEEEGLVVTEEIYNDMASQLMGVYGFSSLSDFEAAYDKAIIEKLVLKEMALEIMIENSVAEERIVPEETE